MTDQNEMTLAQRARIERRLAHAASLFINKAARDARKLNNKAAQLAAHFASLEARKANLRFAVLKNVPLNVVETEPKESRRAEQFRATRDRLLKSMGFAS